jgi:peptide/nickel transport system substrate-binding protein
MKKTILLCLVMCCLTAFQNEKSKKEVVVWLDSAPASKLFSVNSTDRNSIVLAKYLFQSLVDYDPENEKVIPLLIEKLPESRIEKNGEHHLDFTIRKEANWDSGKPITGEDVAFSIKLLFCCSPAKKAYLDNLKSVKINENDAKKFTLIFNNFQAMNESNLEILTIYPQAFYDKKGVLNRYSFQEIRDDKDEIVALQNFESNYNDVESLDYINGSGAYSLKEENKKEIVFERKKRWWCDNVEAESLLFKAYPEMIIFKIIPDINTAETALEKGELDVMTRISPRKFAEDYQKNETMKTQFHFLTPSQRVYSYIGLNISHPILYDKKVRQALAYLMNRQEYIDTVFYGLGEFTEHPFSKKVIEKPISVYDFNLKKAKQLLKEAGWEDRNNNGLLDNAINGELREFKIAILYPSVAETSEDGCLIFQKNCKKVGIEVILEALDYRIFLEKIKTKNFDAYFGLWQNSGIESDMTTLFHSSAYGKGQNYCGFQNNQVDELLENTMTELSFDKRKANYQKIAEIIKTECPYIFLITVNNRIAVSKRFENPVINSLGFGVYIQGLR